MKSFKVDYVLPYSIYFLPNFFNVKAIRIVIHSFKRLTSHDACFLFNAPKAQHNIFFYLLLSTIF